MGTTLGGIRSAIINKHRYGTDFYSVIGTIGGNNSMFKKDPEFARAMGKIGRMKQLSK
jgi:hypothetical protein